MEKEMSPEEMREKRREFAKKTLDAKFFQDVFGHERITKNPHLYGKIATDNLKGLYGSFSSSEDYKNLSDSLFKSEKQEGEELGVSGNPTITDYDVRKKAMEQLIFSKQEISLGDLEKLTKGMAPGFSFKLKDNIKDYSILDLNSKIKEYVSNNKDKEFKNEEELINEALTPIEREALETLSLFSEAYDKAVILKSIDYFGGLNAMGEKIKEKYAENTGEVEK